MNNDDAVNNPSHYGGSDNAYEAIKVIEAWGLGFCLGNTVKYISRAGKKPGEDLLKDLKKARWYIDREISRLEAPVEIYSLKEDPGMAYTISIPPPKSEPGRERCGACGYQNYDRNITCRCCDAEL